MKLIRLPEVLERVALKKTAVYKMISENEFPRPVKLGTTSAWVEQEITDWIQERVDGRKNSSNKMNSQYAAPLQTL
jgi:prophage regulatory protein